MKGRILFTGILAVLLIGIPSQVAAQFWKKWGKEKTTYKKPVQKSKPKPPVSATGSNATAKKKQVVEYPLTKIKSHYRIDVIAPLYLDELVHGDRVTYKNKIPEKAVPGIEFYQGIKLASDSLKSMNYNMDIYVHDITDVMETPESLVYGSQLDSSDLIIGAVQSKDIPVIAGFAKKHHVNFISALSPSDGGVKDNPYFTLVQPSLQTHCNWIKSHIASKSDPAQVLLIYRPNVPSDEGTYNYIVKTDSLPFHKINGNKPLVKKELLPLLDSVGQNVLLVASLDVNYCDSILRQLNEKFPSYKFEVYGMPSWKSMSSLRKPDIYPNIAVNVTTPFNFEVSTNMVQNMEAAFKRSFSGKVNDMVFRGYEMLFWYANLLHEYGVIFNKNVNDLKDAPFTKFQIKPKWDKNLEFLYNENQHLYLYRYQNGSYTVTQ